MQRPSNTLGCPFAVRGGVPPLGPAPGCGRLGFAFFHPPFSYSCLALPLCSSSSSLTDGQQKAAAARWGNASCGFRKPLLSHFFLAFPRETDLFRLFLWTEGEELSERWRDLCFSLGGV